MKEGSNRREGQDREREEIRRGMRHNDIYTVFPLKVYCLKDHIDSWDEDKAYSTPGK